MKRAFNGGRINGSRIKTHASVDFGYLLDLLDNRNIALTCEITYKIVLVGN